MVDEARVAAHVQSSIELEGKGDMVQARAEAEAALAAGGGRDAVIQAAKLAILDQRFDDAIGLLDPLVQGAADDAGAQYNLALAQHHKGDYNRARTGYLAAIRADPSYADARFNLAVLCQAHGFAEEARHHAAKFRQDYADDPRGPGLERQLGASPLAVPLAQPGPATPPSPAP